MLLFLLDVHEIMKFLSLQFQQRNLIFTMVLPLVEKSLLDVANLRKGKGKHMLKFSNDFEGTGAYKGVQLNRGRVATRQKRQARLEEFGVCT